jgi:exonuclease SbcC
MIEHIELVDWKRYDRYETEFKPGLNFVLGPNGSGKSSLLQAIEFALSGLTPFSPAREAVRMGSTKGASVSITFNSYSPRATVTRSIDRLGRVHDVLQADNTDSTAEYLSAALGVDAPELVGMLFVNEGDIYTSSAGDMDLDHHLEQLLPLKALQQVVILTRERRGSLTRLLKGQRSELKVSKDELAQLALRRTEFEAELSGVEQAEPKLRAREQELLDAVRERDAQRQAALHLVSWTEELDRLLESSGMAGVEPGIAIERMEEDLRHSEQQVRDLVARRGRYEGERAGVENAISLLERAEAGACPLCEQPLTDQHRKSLVTAQRTRLSQLDGDLASATVLLTEAESRLSALATATGAVRLAMAQRPEDVIVSQSLPPDLDDELMRVQRDLDDVRDRRRRVFSELAAVRERAAAAETDRRIEAEVVDAFRKDALLQATEDAVTSFTSEVRMGFVMPLSQELGRQWKRFRPRAPWNLIVDNDGHLAIEMHEETRPFAALSGGEKTVALVLLRLALAVAFTRARFMVFDEPLEHLDPRTRRILISSLQHAVDQQLVDQIIVSTYEEAIVRRLQQEGRAHAIYLD